ncbi:MAG: 5-demethoxyubiquinol-8 5-hydroxylase UbiM [Alphaproteobacteria bacterium]|nr:5-demethoxyubiquinol-8 5-hydroxylase UbiM [Alphaproteobacteria bacterium]
MDADLIIVGAGPSGLALAAALSGAPIRIRLVERAPEQALIRPGYDGREIALTPRSVAMLKRIGAWKRFAAEEVAPLQAARVLNGGAPFVLDFQNTRERGAPLGQLVPNAAIRRALYETVRAQDNVEFLCGRAVASVQVAAEAATVTLADGTKMGAALVAAADTRFSTLRREQGIPARMYDFGKSMLVCRMRHEAPHGGIATEWFGHGQTIAMLPLNGAVSSLVLTLPGHAIAPLMAMEPARFAAEMTRRTESRWGALALDGERHVYPLVAVYAERFTATRFALAGDAAVGMHPVTAHGFNFGLLGAETLAREALRAWREAGDIGAREGLARYERAHRRATLPLFLGTNAIATLYTAEHPAARLARNAGLLAMKAALPVRRAVEAWLTGAGPGAGHEAAPRLPRAARPLRRPIARLRAGAKAIAG